MTPVLFAAALSEALERRRAAIRWVSWDHWRREGDQPYWWAERASGARMCPVTLVYWDRTGYLPAITQATEVALLMGVPYEAAVRLAGYATLPPSALEVAQSEPEGAWAEAILTGVAEGRARWPGGRKGWHREG